MNIFSFNFIKRPSIVSVIDDELYQANRDLLNAESQAEHWKHTVEMVRFRKARLEAALKREADSVSREEHKVVTLGAA